MWWRILIPTWRFFDSVGIHPELFVRVGGEWLPAVPRPKMHWYSLFFNPEYNRYHACNNLLERLILELAEGSAIEQLVSYKLVEDLARTFALARSSSVGLFEFKICIQGQDVLVGTGSAVAA